MQAFEQDELTDGELSDLLALWVVPDPSTNLRVRVFQQKTPPSLRTFIRAFRRPRPDRQSRSIGAALVLESAVIALLVVLTSGPTLQKLDPKEYRPVILLPYRPNKPASLHPLGGGGGGQLASSQVAQGSAPRIAPKQFIPPSVAIPNPVLPVAPTITAQAPQIEASNYGDPLSKLMTGSAGPGNSGYGDGMGGGIGNGAGNGYASGRGGGTGSGVYQIGGDVSSPVLLLKVEPEYSEEARKAKYSGVVVLSIVVDAQGIPRNITVVRPLGLGLDEKAIQAVEHWRFRPGVRQGKAVSVQANVEVNFRLL